MKNQEIKIAIADDHHLFRSGIRTILEKNVTFTVVMEADNGQILLDQIQESKALPEVVLLDIRMPVLDGFQTAEQLLQKYPEIKIIVLSMHDEARHIIRMIELGVNGYLLKSALPEEVVSSIELVMENDYFFNQKINVLMNKVIRYKGAIPNELGIPVTLSSREKEVLALICQEFTTKEIGDQLFISARTVEGHRQNLITKMGVRNTAGLVVYAFKHELVTL